MPSSRLGQAFTGLGIVLIGAALCMLPQRTRQLILATAAAERWRGRTSDLSKRRDGSRGSTPPTSPGEAHSGARRGGGASGGGGDSGGGGWGGGDAPREHQLPPDSHSPSSSTASASHFSSSPPHYASPKARQYRLQEQMQMQHQIDTEAQRMLQWEQDQIALMQQQQQQMEEAKPAAVDVHSVSPLQGGGGRDDGGCHSYAVACVAAPPTPTPQPDFSPFRKGRSASPHTQSTPPVTAATTPPGPHPAAAAPRRSHSPRASGTEPFLGSTQSSRRNRSPRGDASGSGRRLTSGEVPLAISPEVTRAATALRAEGKELSHVLASLRQRCGGALLRSSDTREVRLRMTLPKAAKAEAGQGLRAAICRIADACGLRRAEVRSWQDGVQVVFTEEYPPPLHHPDLPPRLYAHAAALHEALQGHHERAVSFFSLIATQVIGKGVRCAVDRPRHLPTTSPAPASSAGAIYPTVPSLELPKRGPKG